MRPVRVAPVAETGSTVAVLVDASRSMTLDDGSGRSRLDAARTMLASTVKPALGPRFAMEPYAFGSRTRAWDDGDPEIGRDGRSDLSGALHDIRERFRGRSLAGIIVVSDGAVAGGAPASPGVPVFAIPVGPTGPVRDREVSAVGAGDASIVDAVVPLVTTIVSRGAASDRFDVSLLENGRPVDVRTVVTEAEGGARREVFRVSPRRDRATLYEIVAAAAPGELTTANNRFAVLIPPAGRAEADSPARRRARLRAQLPQAQSRRRYRPARSTRSSARAATTRARRRSTCRRRRHGPRRWRADSRLPGRRSSTTTSSFSAMSRPICFTRHSGGAARGVRRASAAAGWSMLGTRSFDARALTGSPLEDAAAGGARRWRTVAPCRQQGA